MSWFFEENLADFTPYQSAQPQERFQIVGTSGTVTTCLLYTSDAADE